MQGGGRVKRVILVRFGGGVRLSETFDHPEAAKIIPNLWALRKEAILYTNLRNNGRLDHATATAQMLTGNFYPHGKALGTKRLPHPTIFEYYRKQKSAPADRCLLLDPSWHPTHLDYSSHKNFGANYGAAEIRTRRIGVWQMQTVQKGRKQTDQLYREAAEFKAMLLEEDYERRSLQITGSELKQTKLDGAAFSKVNSYRQHIFDSARIPTKINKSPVRSGDMMTLFCAQRAFQDKKVDPILLMVNFHGPDVAHRGSYSDYLAAVTALDAVIGELWAVHKKDNKAKRSTAVIITPDVGRDLSLTGGGFAGHNSGDLGCRRLFALMLVPGKRGGKQVDRVVHQTQLCPTMGAWLGVKTPHVAKGAEPLEEVV
jgi:hypothetical protein